MPTVDYLPIANNPGANVLDQGSYHTAVTSGNLVTGYAAGVAHSGEVNKTLRQSSVVSSAVATFVANTLAVNILDDGNVSALTSNINSAISSVVTTVATPIANAALAAANVYAASTANVAANAAVVTANLYTDTTANAAIVTAGIAANISANAAVTATIYSGNVSTLTTYPVGAYLLVTDTSGVGAANSNIIVYYGDPLGFSANYFTNNATGAVAGPLTGIWSARGSAPTGGNVTLVQRIS